MAQYTLMPNVCGTLSLAFNGNAIIAELGGALFNPSMIITVLCLRAHFCSPAYTVAPCRDTGIHLSDWS